MILVGFENQVSRLGLPGPDFQTRPGWNQFYCKYLSPFLENFWSIVEIFGI